MKKIGIWISLLIHATYAAVSGAVAFGYWESMKNGGLADTVPEGSGMIGLLVVLLAGAVLAALLLFSLVSLAAVLFEVCDLVFYKRGFAFVYMLISSAFLLLFGKGMLGIVMERVYMGGFLSMWQSGEIYLMLALTLSALIPTLVGLKRLLNK